MNEARKRDDIRAKAVPLLRVAAIQLERLDAADREAARPYVERLIAAAERDMEAGR